MAGKTFLGLLLGSCAVLAGCVHAKATYLADGNKGYAIKCNGMMGDWTGCLVRAGRMCGKNGYLVSYSDEINRNLIVECRSSAATSATTAKE
jgi:hypothetical protein